eukprot:TRINITY_DN2153_c0_g3_i1.p1 TRINITY_DN2153_c0_g3~~TRINITY_DN2153_c0_g3_i1.p1  ORF type:complete len:913 (+),score=182.02 TRINITY_DN2153_c0_g3_i1:1638-4376(+)
MELLRRLGPYEIDDLRNKFGERGLRVEPFSVLLEDATGANLERLCNLFSDIDVKMEGRVTWDQFSMHAIDDGMAAERGAEEEIQQYVLESVYYDEIPHSVKKLHYFEGINKVAKLINRGRQSLVKLCKPLTMTPWKVTSSLGAPPLSAEIIPNNIGHDQLVVSCSDMSMSFWDAPTHGVSLMPLAHTVRLDESQLVCKWSERFSRFLSGSRSGVLNMWLTHDEPVVQSSEKLHHQAINDILMVDNTVLTASMDSTIKITDISRGKVKSELKGHQQGVCLMTYCKEHSLLVSTGYEYDPFVWMFQMNDMCPWKLEDKQRPHRSTLIGLESIPGTPQLISVDQRGMVKVWDVRTLRCVQTLVAEAPSHQMGGQPLVSNTSLAAMCCCPPHQKVIVCGRTMTVFKYNSTALPAFADDKPASVVVYNRRLCAYLTAHEKVIKIWSDTGKVLREYEVPSEVTCCTLDVGGRRFFIGMHNGIVRGYGWTTGQCFVEYQEHLGNEMVSIEFIDRPREPRHLLCCSVKGTWMLPDSEQSRAVHIKCVGKAADDGIITSTCYDLSTSTMVVATTAGSVYTCDMASQNYLWTCAKLQGETRCLIFMGSLPFVIFTENSGLIHLATYKDTTQNQMLSFKVASPRQLLKSMDIRLPDRLRETGASRRPQQVGEQAACVVLNPQQPDLCPLSPRERAPPSHVVTCLDYHVETNELYAGDEKGWVVVYCMGFVVLETKKASPRPLHPAQVGIKRLWAAHYDEIRSLKVTERKRVVTSSFDGQVLVWTANGVCVLSLQQGRGLDTAPAEGSCDDSDSEVDMTPRGRRLTEIEQDTSSPAAFSPLSPLSFSIGLPFDAELPTPPSGLLKRSIAKKMLPRKIKLQPPAEPTATLHRPTPRPKPRQRLGTLILEDVSPSKPGSHFRKKRY